MNVHRRFHQGEKVHKCDLCKYACSDPRRIADHMLIHRDLKPLNCNECNQRFRTKQLLKRHQNLNHNPSYIIPRQSQVHKCTYCTRSFSSKGYLVRHQTNRTKKCLRAEVLLKHKKTENEGKQSQAILEDNKYMKPKVKQAIPIKTKYRKSSCKNCPGCLAKYCGACKSCKDMVRFGGTGTLRQGCKKRKCQKASFGSEGPEPRPVAKHRKRKLSSEKPGRKWSGFFQQVKVLENFRNKDDVNKSLQHVQLLNVDKVLEDVIKSFQTEGEGEEDVGSEGIHKVESEDEGSCHPHYSLLVTLPVEEG